MQNNLFGLQPITTTSFSNDQIIKNIMSLYDISRFDLDCTYSMGQFWKNLPEPVHKSDLYPKKKDVIEANSVDLPFNDESLRSIMFDPPFVIAGDTYKNNGEGSSIIAKRFEGYKDFNELKKHYYGTLKEASRILKENGFIVVKCQDVVAQSKNHFSHCLIMNMSLELGFFPRDLFVLLAKHRINSFNGSKWKRQIHARKHHSFFWVLQKTRCPVNYNFVNGTQL